MYSAKCTWNIILGITNATEENQPTNKHANQQTKLTQKRDSSWQRLCLYSDRCTFHTKFNYIHISTAQSVNAPCADRQAEDWWGCLDLYIWREKEIHVALCQFLKLVEVITSLSRLSHLSHSWFVRCIICIFIVRLWGTWYLNHGSRSCLHVKTFLKFQVFKN